MSNALQIADLHLTAVTRDEYRWRLFPWLRDMIVMHSVRVLIILGDLTEAKDYHSARLVNRIVDEILKLIGEGLERVIIVPGNHDGIDPACPYFRFLGSYPAISYINTPFLFTLLGRQVLCLPHTKEPERWETKLLYEAEVIFMHQTVVGARSETGISLEGMAASMLAGAKRAKIWSGDVHVPQVIGPVEYVGAPYPVRFGDAFKPRAVLLKKGLREATDLEPPYFGRHSITLFHDSPLCATDLTSLKPITVQRGDQAKVRVRMTRAEFVGWEKTKGAILKWAEEGGIELCGLEVERVEEAVLRVKPRGTSPAVASPAQLLTSWAEKQKLEKSLVDVGQKILATVAR